MDTYSQLFSSPFMQKGLNKAVYSILSRIGDFQFYFQEAAKWFAAVCFIMAIGMACIKIFLQACDARQELLKIGMTMVTYLVMLYFFPIAMKNLPKLCMGLGYGAVFQGGVYQIDIEDGIGMGGSINDFYQWMGENTNGIFTNQETYDNVEGARTALNFNIVDVNSGFLDLNKTLKIMWAFILIAFKSYPKLKLFSIEIDILLSVLIFTAGLAVFFYAFIVSIINYIMALIDYFAVFGFGILMIPLSLWDGTKSYTQALLGSIGKVMIKLIVICSVMFLAVMSTVDLFAELYINSIVVKGITLAGKPFSLLEMGMTILVQAPLIFVLTKETNTIANFLSGGNPQMSFGEWARGAMQTAGAVATAVGATNTGANAARGLGSIVASGIAAGENEKLMNPNASKADIAKSVMAGMGNKAGSVLKGAAMNSKEGIAQLGRNINGGLGISGSSSNEGMNILGGNLGPSPVNRNSGNNNEGEGSKNKGNEVTNDGSTGVYGNISEENSELDNSAMKFANSNEDSGNAFKRALAHDVGRAISYGKASSNYEGNTLKSGLKGIKSGIKAGIRGEMASLSNAYGGIKGTFNGVKGNWYDKGNMRRDNIVNKENGDIDHTEKSYFDFKADKENSSNLIGEENLRKIDEGEGIAGLSNDEKAVEMAQDSDRLAREENK